MKFLGVNLGLSYSTKSLRAAIESQHWIVQKVKFDSKLDRYTAEAKDETGQKLTRNGKTERLALSNLLIAIGQRNHQSRRLARWGTTFTDQLAEIAEAYTKAPLYEPKASAAFMELAKDSERRALVLADHLQIQVVNDPEPYKSAEKLVDDVKKKRNLMVSRVGADHPIWSEQQVIAYRICHDVLGYVAAEAGWDWVGENEAFAHHAALLSVEAQKALFSESIAQTAYAVHFRAYGQQKIALFPQFLDKVQDQENPHDKHPGLHPSQSFPAVPLPHAKHIVESSEGEDDTEPHTGLYAFGAFDQRLAVLGNGTINPNLQDPNAAYSSPYESEPIMTPNGQTLQQAYGDPLQVPETQANANLINTSNAPSTNGVEWAYLNQNDPGQVALMKKAIVNAFRVVLLSPRKDLRWNAVHYQDISHLPAEVDDPKVYWDTLEHARQEWNVARGFDRYGHVPYIKQMPALVNVLYQKNPSKGLPYAQRRAARMVQNWATEEQNRLLREDEDKPEAKRREGFQIETKANYNLAARIKLFLTESKPNLDHVVTKDLRKRFKTNPMDMDQFTAMPMTSAVPQPYYHVGWSGDEARVMQQGLLPGDPGAGVEGDQPAGTYLWKTFDDAQRYASTLRDEAITDETPVIYEVRAQGVPDPTMPGSAVYVSSAISPERIRRIAATGPEDLLLDKSKYGAFMGGHLKSLAQISQHADSLLQAALEDVHEHNGQGFHFRAVVLQLGVPGVGPKVCSFAWLLLQPMTSELGTIDTHMMDLLGHQEKEMNNRDYFGMERELKAGRDAAGYSHVPLGQFQWGMWDYKRTGAGVHQDHSAMAVLDPKPHDSIDWAAKEQPVGAAGAVEWKNMWQTQPPEWWANTQEARQQAWDDFRATQANKVGKNKVPWTNVPADYDPDVLNQVPGLGTVTSADAFSGILTPWFAHPQSGEHIIGLPGQSIMSHASGALHMTPQEIWTSLPDEAVGKF